MKMEQIECSETPAYKIQTPGITQKKTYNIQNTAKVWNKKWCKFVSPSLLNNTYGLPVLTMDTKYPNQIFYVWLVDLQIICAK
jgi:hypothetical protein